MLQSNQTIKKIKYVMPFIQTAIRNDDYLLVDVQNILLNYKSFNIIFNLQLKIMTTIQNPLRQMGRGALIQVIMNNKLTFLQIIIISQRFFKSKLPVTKSYFDFVMIFQFQSSNGSSLIGLMASGLEAVNLKGIMT